MSTIDYYRCLNCGRCFDDWDALERHEEIKTRNGRVDRRCLTDQQLATVGLVKNRRGTWLIPKPRASR